MIRWKLVVPHTIIQIMLLLFLVGIFSFAITSCGPTEASGTVAILLPVLLLATATLTFPLGWLVIWLVGLTAPVWLVLIGAGAALFANSLFWNQFLQAWQRFWNRFEEKQKHY